MAKKPENMVYSYQCDKCGQIKIRESPREHWLHLLCPRFFGTFYRVWQNTRGIANSVIFKSTGYTKNNLTR
jgi:hypothetical protein